MGNEINVNLTIKDNTNNSYLSIPVLPPTIAYSEGERQADTINIINLGDVDFLKGVALDNMSWSSFFPKNYDPSYCKTSALLDPVAYKAQFRNWKNEGTSLQIICPAAGINTAMYIKNFSWELRGYEGDIYYTVDFSEVKQVRPVQIPVTVTSGGTVVATTSPATARPPVVAQPTPKTYTVVSGDNLTRIAKKLGISGWRTIYNLNTDKIKNPNVIYPGQVLRIP